MKKTLYILVSLLIVVSALLVTGCSSGDSDPDNALAPMVQIDDHYITFLHKTYDPDTDVSQWTYRVTSDRAPSISHWTIEFCGDCADFLGGSEEKVTCGSDPTTGIKGIKFDTGYSDNEVRTVWFELRGDYPEGDVYVGIKAGPDEHYGWVTGPLCEPVEPDLASLGDYVWDDLDGDGIQDEGEPGLADVTVRLYKCDDTFVAETTTDADGLYLFADLDPGDYKVRFILPEGYVFSPQYQGADTAKDSNADPDTGFSACVTLASGESNLTIDAGMYQTVATIKLDKSAAPEIYTSAGQEITYTFAVENTGEVTLTNVKIDDPTLGITGLAVTPSTLEPGETGTVQATYTVSGDDVNAGSIYNVATATGTPPVGDDVTDTDDETVTHQTASIHLDKSAAPQTYDAVGDVVTYTFTVENTGEVTLTNVKIDDPTLGITGLAVTPSTLEPGQTGTVQATYTVSGDDVNAGSIYNVANATGTPPVGDDVTDTDDETVTHQTASIHLDKSSHCSTCVIAGQRITYTFVVTNDGDVPLTGVTIDDPMFVGEDAPVFVSSTMGSPEGTLLPGESATYTASYAVPEAGVEGGLVENSATVAGTPPIGPGVSDTDCVECMCICGFVYEYGTMQGLAGWEVILEKKGSPWVYVDSTLTDEEGKYCFCACEVGEYKIREVVQPGWTQVSPLPNEHVWLVPEDGGGDPVDGPFLDFVNTYGNPSSPPSHTVGWEGSPVNRLAVMAPWIALLALIAGASVLTLRRRRA